MIRCFHICIALFFWSSERIFANELLDSVKKFGNSKDLVIGVIFPNDLKKTPKITTEKVISALVKCEASRKKIVNESFIVEINEDGKGILFFTNGDKTMARLFSEKITISEFKGVPSELISLYNTRGWNFKPPSHHYSGRKLPIDTITPLVITEFSGTIWEGLVQFLPESYNALGWTAEVNTTNYREIIISFEGLKSNFSGAKGKLKTIPEATSTGRL